MTLKPRTIDNMGVDASSRYARDKATLDTRLVEDSRIIPLKTEIATLKPQTSTEFDLYLGPNKQSSWASFEPPPQNYANAFGHELISSLGGYEKLEGANDKLEALEKTLNQQTKALPQEGSKPREEEKERKTILSLLQTINKLDRILSLVNSRRNQYQRG